MLTKIFGGILVLVTLLACQFSGNVSIQGNADGTLDVTVTLNESEVNTLVQNALARTTNPLLRDPQVDLQNGQIVVNGTHDRRDGQGSVSGSVVFTATVQNGQVVVQATQANIEGMTVSDARITELNQRLADAFGQRMNQAGQRAQVKAIQITDTTISVTVNVQRQ